MRSPENGVRVQFACIVFGKEEAVVKDDRRIACLVNLGHALSESLVDGCREQ